MNDIFFNLNGVPITLIINKGDSSSTCTEFVIKYFETHKVKKLYIILWLLLTPFAIFISTSFPVVGISGASLLILLSLIFMRRLLSIESESLMFIASIGVQITETYPFGRKVSQFIPWHDIKDVFINEVIHLQRVLFHLVLLKNDIGSNPKLIVPLFANTTPPLACLEIIYTHIQRVLQEHDKLLST